MKIAFLESLGIRWVLSNMEESFEYNCNKDNLKIFFDYYAFGGSQSWAALIG